MAITEVMHDPERRDIPDRQEQRVARRGGPCLICGEWIESEAENAYRVLVSNLLRQGEYPCHEVCFSGYGTQTRRPPSR